MTPSFVAERAAFRILLPFVLPQGLWVKLRARRFSAAAGPTEGSVGAGETFRLLAIGDSIVAGVGVGRLEDAMPGQLASALASALSRRVEWIARGVSGIDARRTRRTLLADLVVRDLDCAFVSVGVNDVTGLRTAARWREEIVGLVEDLRRMAPRALIVVSGLPPLHGFPLLPEPLRSVFALRARTFDRIAEAALAALPGVLFAPNRFEPEPHFFAPDGYHPSAQSCRIWAAHIAALVTSRGQVFI